MDENNAKNKNVKECCSFFMGKNCLRSQANSSKKQDESVE